MAYKKSVIIKIIHKFLKTKISPIKSTFSLFLFISTKKTPLDAHFIVKPSFKLYFYLQTHSLISSLLT